MQDLFCAITSCRKPSPETFCPKILLWQTEQDCQDLQLGGSTFCFRTPCEEKRCELQFLGFTSVLKANDTDAHSSVQVQQNSKSNESHKMTQKVKMQHTSRGDSPELQWRQSASHSLGSYVLLLCETPLDLELFCVFPLHVDHEVLCPISESGPSRPHFRPNSLKTPPPKKQHNEVIFFLLVLNWSLW